MAAKRKAAKSASVASLPENEQPHEMTSCMADFFKRYGSRPHSFLQFIQHSRENALKTDGVASKRKLDAAFGMDCEDLTCGENSLCVDFEERLARTNPWKCVLRPAKSHDRIAISAAAKQFFDDNSYHTMKELSKLPNLFVLAIPVVQDRFNNRIADVVVAYASWELTHSGEKAELVALAVHRSVRRLGFGRRFLGFLMWTARNAGAAEMELQVRPENVAARALYEKFGFRHIAVLPKYYGPGLHPGHLMRAQISIENPVVESLQFTGVASGYQVTAGSIAAWSMLARAVKAVAHVVQRRAWHLKEVLELPPQPTDRSGFVVQGFNAEDGRILVSVKSAGVRDQVAPYKDVLATLLHELTHFVHLGHGKAFYAEFGKLVRDASVSGLEECQGLECLDDVKARIGRVELDTPQRWRAFRSALRGEKTCHH